MCVWVQKSASMQKRTSPLAEKSGLNSVSNLSTKRLTAVRFSYAVVRLAGCARCTVDLRGTGAAVQPVAGERRTGACALSARRRPERERRACGDPTTSLLISLAPSSLGKSSATSDIKKTDFVES